MLFGARASAAARRALWPKALGAACALTLITGRASGAQVDPALGLPSLSWQAPRGCPDGSAVASRLLDVLDGASLPRAAGWQVHGRVSGQSDRWVLVLELREAAGNGEPRQRVLGAQSCDQLVEAAAVAIAIALDEESAAASVLPESASTLDRAESSSNSVLPLDASAKSTADDAAGAPRVTRLWPALGVVFDAGSLGGWAAGASVGLQVWSYRWGLETFGLWLPPHARSLGTDQSADFSLLAAGLRGCYELWGDADRFAVAPCVGFELGRFTAESHGLREATAAHDLWVASTWGVGTRVALWGALGLSARLEGVLPLSRQQYRVDLDQPVHEIPRVTLRAGLALDVNASAH